MTVAVGDEPVVGLEGFGGLVLKPGDAGYEEERRVHNGLIDKRPALIAQARGVADVVAAVNLARERGLELSIRGGGHNVSGKAVTEGGLMLDLSLMKGIHVDPAARTVRAQGGVLWGELNRETQLHGLAVTGGVISSTGIAGLTLGAGLGWLLPSQGFAADNLVSVQLVTADGSVLTASESEHEDLFWAVRGGGGNFGVATSFEYRLRPVGPLVTGGMIIHPFDAARDVWRGFGELTADLPDELMTVAGLVHAPDGSGMKVCGILVCHVGSPEQAERDLAPILGLGEPIATEVGPIPYSVMNTLLDEAYPKGSLNYWKSSFMRTVPDEAIDIAVEAFGRSPSPMSGMILEHFHGAVTRVPVTATACPHRDEGYNFLATSVWTDPADTEANVAWTRELFEALEPFFTGRRWLNYLGEDDMASAALAAAYGPNQERLAQIKAAYDPTNLFRLNLNVEPAA